MQGHNLQFRYRSIKYSTSSLSLAKAKTENNQPPPKSRLSLASSNASTPQLCGKQTPKRMPLASQENRWSTLRAPSSHYKLRILANSSHMRTRCSQAEEERVVQEKNEQQECVILPVSSGCPPFEAYFNLLQESLNALQPQLEEQRIETQRIQQGLVEIRRQAEAQLRQGETEVQSKLQKLRKQLGNAFKEHSRQIINTREAVSHLRMDLQELSSLTERVREGAGGLEGRLCGPG